MRRARALRLGTLRFISALSALAAAPSGCVVGETAPPAPPTGVVVATPPPPPLAERPPAAAPQQGAVWVAGYWHWSGLQYVWIPGHWEHAREGRRWRAPRYSMRDGAYVYEPGGWK